MKDEVTGKDFSVFEEVTVFSEICALEEILERICLPISPSIQEHQLKVFHLMPSNKQLLSLLV